LGPFFAQPPAPVALARLLDPRGEAGVADQLARAGEASDVADLGRAVLRDRAAAGRWVEAEVLCVRL
jgi:hypothetical protein